jgi:hypothetical protein
MLNVERKTLSFAFALTVNTPPRELVRNIAREMENIKGGKHGGCFGKIVCDGAREVSVSGFNTLGCL